MLTLSCITTGVKDRTQKLDSDVLKYVRSICCEEESSRQGCGIEHMVLEFLWLEKQNSRHIALLEEPISEVTTQILREISAQSCTIFSM